MVIELGGAAVEFRIGDAALRTLVECRYRLFRSDAAPQWTVDVSTFGPGRSKLLRPFLPKVEAAKGTLKFSRGDARFELSGRHGKLEIWPNPWSFDAAARIIYSRLLSRRRAFFMHAAAITDGGKTVLVPGRSGDGKTTLVETCGEGASLGDELVLIRRGAAGFEAVATPFWGNGREAARAGRGRIDAIAFLDRAVQPAVRPLPRGESLRRASRCLVWFGEPSAELAGVWRELAELIGGKPAFGFSFRKGSSPWTMLKEAVA